MLQLPARKTQKQSQNGESRRVEAGYSLLVHISKKISRLYSKHVTIWTESGDMAPFEQRQVRG